MAGLAFGGLALAAAWWRVPYDDEWFSLTLLTEVGDADGFWRSLAADVHPPWLAVLDRAVHGVSPGRMPLHLLHLLFTAGAVACLASVVRRRLGLGAWTVWLAALHPVVLFYASALRWYPLLLLGHALRHWALWSGAAHPRRAFAFGSGAVVGAAAGYLDALFLAHDLAWWLLRERRRAARLAAFAAAVCAAGVHVTSLSATGHLERLAALRPGTGALENLATWALLGPLGEALPHYALLLLSPVVALLGLVGLWRLCEARGARELFFFLLSLAACWALATPLGVWLPRYSMELWLWSTLGVIALALDATRLRLAACAGLLALSVGLACTVSGRGFFKADLNALPGSLCGELVPRDGTQLYVVPYHRLRAQVSRRCGFPVPALQLPHVRHRSAAAEDTALRRALDGVTRVTLLALTSHSSLTLSRRRAQRILEERCERLDETALWSPPHAGVREKLLAAPARRVRRVRYQCR